MKIQVESHADGITFLGHKGYFSVAKYNIIERPRLLTGVMRLILVSKNQNGLHTTNL